MTRSALARGLAGLAAVSMLFTINTGSARAQESEAITEEVEIIEVIEEDEFKPGDFIPVNAGPYTETQGSQADSFYGVIHYDIYDRTYRVDDYFPLGYSARVTYEYYPKAYETSRGWEPVVARESGTFMRGSQVIATYVKTFDVRGARTSYSRNGFSVMVPIMKTIGGIVGIDFTANL